MRGTRVPQVFKHPTDRSITLSYHRPKYSLIWLHGLNDQTQSFVPYFTHLHSPLFQHCRIKLLQAPKRFITLNQAQGNAWFDIKSTQRFNLPEAQVYDLNQLQTTTNIIGAHFKEQQSFWSAKEPESKLFPQHRIFIGGFSQGGVAALHYALTTPHVPAGVISVGGYLLKYTNALNLGRLPILLMHGTKDSVVREGQAKTSYARLLQSEGLTQYNTTLLGHEMGLQQLDTLGKWLGDTFTFINKHYEGQPVTQ